MGRSGDALARGVGMAALLGAVVCCLPGQRAAAQTSTPTALPTPAQLVEHATAESPCLSTDADSLPYGSAFYVTTAGVSDVAQADWYEVRERVNDLGPWSVIEETPIATLCSVPYAVSVTIATRAAGLYRYRFYARQWPSGPVTSNQGFRQRPDPKQRCAYKLGYTSSLNFDLIGRRTDNPPSDG